MNTKKTVVTLALSCTMIANMGAAAYAAPALAAGKETKPTTTTQTTLLNNKSMTNKVEIGLKATKQPIKATNRFVHVNLNVPVIIGLKDSKYEEQLNDILMRHAMKEKAEVYEASKKAEQVAKKQKVTFEPATLNSDFRFVKNGNVLSLIVDTYKITSAEANGESRTDTYTFLNEDDAHALQLSDLFNKDTDYKALLGNVVRNQIALKKNKEDFNFEKIKDTQSFYVSNGYLVLTFDRYEIAPGAAGSQNFKIQLASIQSKLSDTFKQALKG
ncbi:DUF3298 and DUF4163 domain-containing protein [Paenibacillus alvei]|uniref:DUF3298 and DUF4163 domain-containing protein n=1 Tax=Paenibacillus alvei TaxID=44250 RepID=UPI00227F6916|nr:DUF3298 and DUF4163 domain-containing protein [Paenibacillus alvei]MCY7484859.1 DUF3298 and DUF4163 domain-containing protein [Paenibacillus alvei]